jgi:hypothetical protein
MTRALVCAAFQMHFWGGYRKAWRENLMAWVGERRRRERRKKRGRVVNGERRAMVGVERRRASALVTWTQI